MLPAARTCPNRPSRDYSAALIAALRPVLEASGGRAFLLFASHRALREAAEALRDGPWPLFVQGEAPRASLLERFRESGNGVLLGAASFREGVDVAGDALSVVVIDKLPFAAPDDPVFEARLEAMRRNGGNPFRDEQLPQAVIALKQGAGPPDPQRDRSRRAGAVRSAPARQELRPGVPRLAAAAAAHPRARRRAALLSRQNRRRPPPRMDPS